MKTNANTEENNDDNPDAALRQKIEERAYYLWLESGCGHGDHEHHWLQAERELMKATRPDLRRRGSRARTISQLGERFGAD